MELYHILNRGVEKRNIVTDDSDRLRFIHDLYAFNDRNATPNYILAERLEERPRDLLVSIHAFCLMENHYHLIVSPLSDEGISLFRHKLNMGYAKYFNERHERSGVLWQGAYKHVLVDRDAYFNYLPYYVHLNPLDYSFPEWREGNVRDAQAALEYLKGYRWSSHLDYLGVRNFPSVIDQHLLGNALGDRLVYEKQIGSLIRHSDLARDSVRFEAK